MNTVALQWFWLEQLSLAALFVLVFVALYKLLASWPRRRGRWPVLRWNKLLRRKDYPAGWLKVLGIRLDSPALEHRRQLLARSGFQADPVGLEIGRRVALAFACILLGAGTAMWRLHVWEGLVQPVYVMLVGAIVLVFASADRMLLESIGKQRGQLIMKEIYALSNQLLYYNGSKQSLHQKLARCLPFTRIIRGDVQLLLNEWYSGADQAIRRFKERLGTDEAYSFAETINSMRLYESDSYYALLRTRIQDYKEKLELAKDSRKETTSYVLFVLAGLPIMNTFRIFIYPWVMEGQKLFQTLQ